MISSTNIGVLPPFPENQVKKGRLVRVSQKKDYGSVVLVAFVVGINMNGILPFADQ